MLFILNIRDVDSVELYWAHLTNDTRSSRKPSRWYIWEVIGLQVSQSRSMLVTSRDLREQFVGRRSEIKVNFSHKLRYELDPCSFQVVFIRIDLQFSFEKYSYFVMGIITFGNFGLKRGVEII